VLVALEALDVAVAELDVAREGVAEAPEVVARTGLLPRLLAERLGPRDVGGQLDRHAHGALEVAFGPAHEPHVVGVGVLGLGPGGQGLEQGPESGIALTGVDDAGDGRRPLGPRLRSRRRHHRLLVPEQQEVERVQIAQLGHPQAEGPELGRSRGHPAARS
jgi:hypothetical protein